MQFEKLLTDYITEYNHITVFGQMPTYLCVQCVTNWQYTILGGLSMQEYECCKSKDVFS